MRRTAAVLAWLLTPGLLLTVAGPSQAGPSQAGPSQVRPSQAEAPRGFEAAAQLELTRPFGSAGADRRLANEVAYRGAVGVGLTYRLDRWALGAAASAGLGAGGDCPEPGASLQGSCSLQDGRLMLLVRHHPLSWQAPWVELGLGWELSVYRFQLPVTVQGAAAVATIKERRSGPLAQLTFGVALPVEGALSLSPIVTVAVGRSGGSELECPPTAPCPAGAEAAVHGWFGVGVRGTYGGT